MTVFAIQAQHPEVPVVRISLATVPFLLAHLVLVALLIAMPGSRLAAGGGCTRCPLLRHIGAAPFRLRGLPPGVTDMKPHQGRKFVLSVPR